MVLLRMLLSFLPVFFLLQASVVFAKSFADKKVLIVMSYHQGYAGEAEVKKGIETVLAGSRLKYFYLDTKINFKNGVEKARQAYQLYEQFLPDAVIAVNDNAQSLLVLPYLKGKVKTPVIFCGVNNEATKYGYPAVNVTGVLEKKHYREAISFAQLVKPTIKKIGVIYKPNRSNSLNLEQINQEKKSYFAQLSAEDIREVLTYEEVLQTMEQLQSRVDAVLLLNLTGIVDMKGQALEAKEVIKRLVAAVPVPLIGANDWEVKAGVLCGVIQSDEEQGWLAAEMLVSIWQGTDLRDLPVIGNKNGLRYINITTMKKLGISPQPAAIMAAKIVVSAGD